MRASFRFKNWPLRIKMAVLLAIASFLPLATATLLDIQTLRQQLLNKAIILLAARADQLVGNLDAFHRVYRNGVSKLARVPEVIAFCEANPADSDRLKPGLRATLAVPASDAAIRGVAVLDPSGTVKIATEAQLTGLNLSYHSYIQRARRGDIAISDVHLAEPQVNYAPTIAYVAPIRGSDQKMIGLAVFWVRATAFWDIARSSNGLAGSNSFAVLFDHHGIRIGHSYSSAMVFHPGGRLDRGTIDALVAEKRFGTNTRQLLETVKPFPEQFTRARAESLDPGVFRGFAPVNQAWNYGVARRLTTVRWTIFYMVPVQSVIAPISTLVRKKLIFAGEIMLVALVVGTLSAGVLLKPIRSLSNATEMLARGDLAARVAENRGDELGRLGRSFNSMAAQIEERTTGLREGEERFRVLVESVKDYAIFMLDSAGRVATWNDGARATKGYRAEEIIGRSFACFYTPEDIAADKPARELEQARERGHYEDEGWRVRKDSSRFWADVVITALFGTDGELRGFTKLTRNITERRQAEEKMRELNTSLQQHAAQLEVSNKELEAFSYSVAHDLRSPLRAIDGFSLALSEDYGTNLDKRAKSYLERIRASAQRMGQLIDDLLQLSRVTRSEMRREEVDLSALAKDILTKFQQQEPQRVVECVIPDGVVGEGDPQLLHLALENLLGNAWKFTGKTPQATIELGVERQNGRTIYFVRDNGAGFNMAYANKLFGPFQRLHAAGEFSGTGAGLTIVQRIIQRHSGKVWARGAEGKGAKFSFTL
jgi:PAS domain S-box-containing protein